MTAVDEPIDLLHLGEPRVIAAYVAETEDGPALFDCGPAVTLPALRAALADRGLAVADLRHLFVTHVHLDHAGGAGALVEENPALQVHASEAGLLHLAYPAALENGARAVYGERYDALWGGLAPIPEANLHAADGVVAGVEAFPTPGHAPHHVAFAAPDGTLYAGDAAGVRIMPSDYVLPPTSPPDVDLGAWWRTLDELERRAPERIALTHFGVVGDGPEHLDQLRRRLEHWERLVGDGMGEEEFVATVGREVAEHPEQDAYQRLLPLSALYQGVALGLGRATR